MFSFPVLSGKLTDHKAVLVTNFLKSFSPFLTVLVVQGVYVSTDVADAVVCR